MDGSEVHDPSTDKHILDWDESDVHHWLSSLGYSQYGEQIKGRSHPSLITVDSNNSLRLEHKIQGDSLCMLDSDGLKAFGITTIGQRLSILKSIYHLKIAHNIPFSEDDYVPPCMSPLSRHHNLLTPRVAEALSSTDVSLEKIHSTIKEQGMILPNIFVSLLLTPLSCSHSPPYIGRGQQNVDTCNEIFF